MHIRAPVKPGLYRTRVVLHIYYAILHASRLTWDAEWVKDACVAGRLILRRTAQTSTGRFKVLRNLMRTAAATLAVSAIGSGMALAEIRNVEIIAPSGPGGGWDQTARAVQEVLRD
jgi:hypothetical protein